MQIDTQELLNELAQITEACSAAVKQFRSLPAEQLNYRKTPGSWSILECIEHLNLYGDFYLPEIEKQLLAQQQPALTREFKSGLLGNYFAGLMRVENGTVKKMRSPADKNPVGSALSITTLDRFLKQQDRLLNLLALAASVDLTRTKTAISLTKLVRLRMGDTLRFYIYHIERHVIQAQNVLAIQTGAH